MLQVIFGVFQIVNQRGKRTRLWGVRVEKSIRLAVLIGVTKKYSKKNEDFPVSISKTIESFGLFGLHMWINKS